MHTRTHTITHTHTYTNKHTHKQTHTHTHTNRHRHIPFIHTLIHTPITSVPNHFILKVLRKKFELISPTIEIKQFNRRVYCQVSKYVVMSGMLLCYNIIYKQILIHGHTCLFKITLWFTTWIYQGK